MKKTILLGAGSIGKRHLMNAVTAGVRCITIVDPREDRQKEARERAEQAFRALSPGQKTQALDLSFAGTSEEAYQKYGSFQAVLIAMPPSAHLREVEKAIQCGAAIFCEKPLAKDDLKWSYALELLEEIENRKLVTLVAYNYRFCAQLMQLRQLLQSDVVGKIHSIRGMFSECVRDWHPWEGLNFYMSSKELGGGALLDESHLVDLCRWLFGDISEVVAFNEAISSLKNEPVFETDDLVEMMVRFESGAVGSIHMDLFGRYHQKRIEVVGETGSLFWHFDNSDLASNRIEIWRGKRGMITPNTTQRVPEAVYHTDWNERNVMYLEEMRYFYQSIEAKKNLRSDVPTIADGLKTMAVLRAARRSAESKKFESVERVGCA